MNSNIVCAVVIFACLYYASEARHTDLKSTKMDDMDYKWSMDSEPKSIKFRDMQNNRTESVEGDQYVLERNHKLINKPSDWQIERRSRLDITRRMFDSNERNTISKDTM